MHALFIRASASDRLRLALGCGVTVSFTLSVASRYRCLLSYIKTTALRLVSELILSHRARPLAFDEIVYLYNLAFLLIVVSPNPFTRAQRFPVLSTARCVNTNGEQLSSQ